MICFVALFVFAILGLFSVKYRSYFFEAFDCVLRKATLRKCTTSFDKKMKMKVSARVSKFNKPLGSFVFKNFDVLSWILTIIMVISLIWSFYVAFMGIYNYFIYGNCDGPNSNAVCVYNAVASTTPDLFCFLGDNAMVLVPGIILVLVVVWFLFIRKQK